MTRPIAVAPLRHAVPVIVIAAALAVVASEAYADVRTPAADDPAWRAECGSCHVPYPPALLSARNWRTIMGTLERHFGEDASLPPAARDAVAAFLVRNAASKARHEAPASLQPRITATPWFRHEHDEVAARIFASAAVRSAANCGACHPGADRGDFSERAVRIPDHARATR